jgi:glycosyltransferase involved in cell wall biosynthesis
MSDRPTVSVVTAVFNGAADLDETLASVLGQLDEPIEYVLVNDGSTDGSGAILDRWAARDPRLLVIHQENTGLTRALIQGCRRARGDYIARQDVGDTSLPGRFAAQAALLRTQPRLAFVACQYQLVGPRGEPLSSSGNRVNAESNPLQNADGSLRPSPHHGTVMFRKAAYLQAGEYRPEFYFAQDADLWSRLIELGDLSYAPGILYQAKFDLGGITARNRAAQEKLRVLVREAKSLRRAGKSDADVLIRARQIRPGGASAQAPAARDDNAAAAYFVGSCLAQRRDPRARTYFIQALRREPWHLKSWVKLVFSALTTPGSRP